jgi:MFS family permease
VTDSDVPVRWIAGTVIAGAGIAVGSYDLGAISVAFGPLQAQWHLSSAVVTTLGTATLAGMLAGSLVTGFAADRFGRRRLIIADIALFVAASAVAALAPDFAVLAAARLATGAAIGMDFAVVFPFVAETAPAARRGRAMAWIMWAANFGTLAAYGLGSVFLHADPASGWRAALGFGGLLALPLLGLRGRLGEPAMWGSSRLPSLAAVARAARGHFRGGARPGAAAAATALYQVSDQGLGLVLPLLLATVLSSSAATGAAAAAAVKAITIPAALLTVWGIDRIGRRRLQVCGFIGRAVPLGVLGFFLLAGDRVPAALTGALLAASYFSGAAGPDKTTVMVPAEAPESSIRGTSQGLSQAAGRLGGIIGVTCYGILAGVAGPGAGLELFAGTALAGAAVSVLAIPRPARVPGQRPGVTATRQPREARPRG